MTQEQQLVIEQHGQVGIIRLNRVASLNALSIEMIQGIHQQVLAWQNDTQVQAIIIASNSAKAFSAGGDIRYIYDSYYAGKNKHLDYFADEYAMLNDLYTSKKPLIALVDGYVLGGGFGLAQACHIRVSSEKSRFAMPETVIGYFPDVAATYFLSRLDEIGLYLALTGEQISASDAFALKLVDGLVLSEHLAELEQQIIQAKALDLASIQALIAGYSEKLNALQLDVARIQRYFAQETIEHIELALAQANEADQAWAHSLLEILKQRSPVAKRASLKLQQLGRQLTRAQAMELEREVQHLWFTQGDFIEGVRALIIDKDKQPKWRDDHIQLDSQIEALVNEQKALSA
jgi:enoyl-CoA hydratase/carnithine racemase